MNIGDIIDFKDFRLVEKFMRNANSGRQERLDRHHSYRKMAGNLKAEWWTRFIVILHYLDSNHEDCVLKEVFTMQFTFANGSLTLITNRIGILFWWQVTWISPLFGGRRSNVDQSTFWRKKEKDMTNFKTHFWKMYLVIPPPPSKFFTPFGTVNVTDHYPNDQSRAVDWSLHY